MLWKRTYFLKHFCENLTCAFIRRRNFILTFLPISKTIMSSPKSSWEQFKKFYKEFPSIELAMDLSRIGLTDAFLKRMDKPMVKAFSAMAALEKGAIANPDEGRMVGHYWLRNPALSPTRTIRTEIENTVKSVKAFARAVHVGKIRGQGGNFQNFLVVGIGGSALGPQFVGNALGNPQNDKLRAFFMDNTDPDGIQRVISSIGNSLNKTLCIVISKSGGTKETRNGMLETKAAYERAGLKFEKHAVAVTGNDSELDRFAASNKWIKRFPMWDWVGGRTSELSAVGLLPAALQGFDVDGLLLGAKTCDIATRSKKISQNPAALLALSWYSAGGNGKGGKNMVVIPYKDRLELLSKYLQQLIMESLGKERDIHNRVVNQGITVLGNKGSTDQHSYIQQLRDGLSDFFLTFIEVKKDQNGKQLLVEDQFTSGDYLSGFLLGTRQAMLENNRPTLTLTVNDVSPFTIGVLIALYERAVGFYASLVDINAYHQPGVESGKKAATRILKLQKQIVQLLQSNRGNYFSVDQISSKIEDKRDNEHVFKILERLAANSQRGIIKKPGKSPFNAQYAIR
jgi:glucose-6-phosphate isomerase